MALAGLCSLTDLEAIFGRHIRLPDPPYVFARLSEFSNKSTDSSRLRRCDMARRRDVLVERAIFDISEAQGAQRLAASRGQTAQTSPCDPRRVVDKN